MATFRAKSYNGIVRALAAVLRGEAPRVESSDPDVAVFLPLPQVLVDLQRTIDDHRHHWGMATLGPGELRVGLARHIAGERHDALVEQISDALSMIRERRLRGAGPGSGP
jgi:hypothetical protein